MKKVLFFDMYQTLVDTQIGDKKEIVENAYRQVFSNFLVEKGVEMDLANNFQSNYKKLQDEFYSHHDKEKEHHDFKILFRTHPLSFLPTQNYTKDTVTPLLSRLRSNLCTQNIPVIDHGNNLK